MIETASGVDASPPSPERVAELVRSLAEVMRDAAVTELDLAAGSLTVRLRRPTWDVENGGASPSEETCSAPHETRAADHVITAPMIGTFYGSPTPGSKPFVREGEDVLAGQTIGIIEAMKIMNEIAADRSGTIERILVDNGQPVEYGSPLVRLLLGKGER